MTLTIFRDNNCQSCLLLFSQSFKCTLDYCVDSSIWHWLQISQDSASTYFRWKGHFRHSFVKAFFRDSPSHFYWNQFIFDKQGAKKISWHGFFETRCKSRPQVFTGCKLSEISWNLPRISPGSRWNLLEICGLVDILVYYESLSTVLPPIMSIDWILHMVSVVSRCYATMTENRMWNCSAFAASMRQLNTQL